jgi:hypothetical protein
MQRHGRQVRLAEVGDAGQARIARASVAVRLDGPAADVAVRYLAGAGVARVVVRDALLAEAAHAVDPAVEAPVDARLDAETLALELPLHDPAARALAQGAWVALREIRLALEGNA